MTFKGPKPSLTGQIEAALEAEDYWETLRLLDRYRIQPGLLEPHRPTAIDDWRWTDQNKTMRLHAALLKLNCSKERVETLRQLVSKKITADSRNS